MLENGYYWRNRELREHVAVIDGEVAPTRVLKNGIYLNTYTKQWLKANIWLFDDRIVYVGNKLPINQSEIEMIDCTGYYLVPGYMEPHAHPFQLYNPETYAAHVATFGTTTLINDNLMWSILLDKKKAFSILRDFQKLPVSMYWWARFDGQTTLQDEEACYNSEDVLEWLAHPAVIQGGELTSWPSLLDGDDRMLYWMQEANRQGKPVEGHFPGASEETLTKMKLLGVASDHEATTGEEVIRRLQMGYHVGLRYSSIRPDLPELLGEILAAGITDFNQMTMTTDGASPSFYEAGGLNLCLAIAIDKGVPLEEAYKMVTLNVAKHYQLTNELGSIAPGRLAHINFLRAKDDPTPVHVLAKGQWVKCANEPVEQPKMIDWEQYGIGPMALDWDLQMDDLQFSVPIGLDLISDVLVKAYPIKTDVTLEQLPEQYNDAFLMLVDRYGKWRVNTTLRGFTNRLGALVSSCSMTGDIVCVGKNKQDMLLAWRRMREIGGGIVLVHQGEVLFELALALDGLISADNMTNLITQEKQLKKLLKDFGYPYADPIYSILFLTATHLPYIRITQKGIVDVKKREVLFPATMR